MSQYKFYCLCLDHDGKHLGDIFSLKISSGEVVSELQQAIKVQKALVTAHLEANQLILWTLLIPVPASAKNAETTRNPEIARTNFPPPDSDAAWDGNGRVRRLDPSVALSQYWPKPPKSGDLHILVRLPPPGPPKHCPSWLVEFYDKLWGKWGKLEHEIFRAANLTKQDFQELQVLLDTQNPGRTTDLYEPQDVLAIKAGFLRERSQPLEMKLGDGLVPRFVDVTQSPSFNNDDDDDVDVTQVPSSNNDDDNAAVDIDSNDNAAMDIDSNDNYAGSHMDHLLPETGIFPYTIRYVDLTGLNLESDIRVPLLMLFRNEWDTMIDIFNKINIEGVKGSAVFTGQPGIGKTCLLHAILILCMLHGRKFVFQDKEGNVYVIDSTGISTLERSKVSDCAVLALVDADGDRCQPTEGLLANGRCRILLISSPKKYSDRKWLKQHGNSLEVYTMEIWSRKEFVVASLFLHKMDITLKLLQEVSNICGNIPRPCYEAAKSPDALHAAKHKIENAVKQIKDISDVMHTPESNTGQTIHRVFQVHPASSKSRRWESHVKRPVSDWAFSKMLERLPKDNMKQAFRMYCAIQGPDAATLRSRIFEKYLHHYLGESRTFTIKSLDNPSATLPINTTPGASLRPFEITGFSGCLASSVQSHTSSYLKPQSPVFPSFDSFLYLPGISGFSPLIALQVTIAATHAIKIKGLDMVQKALKSQKLEPTNKEKMIILFVVPKGTEDSFDVQKITGPGKVNDWYAKAAQYIVGFSEEELFDFYMTNS